MVNRIRASDGPCGLNKGRSSKFRFRQENVKKGRGTHWPKRYKDENNNLKTLNDKNKQF